jgi:GNAT superfamily N-acetyltransferase
MVHASHHRKGIGRRLLQERLRWIAGQPGIELIRVATTKLVAGFYECNGFTTFSVEADYYGTRLDRCDLVLHRAQLADFA